MRLLAVSRNCCSSPAKPRGSLNARTTAPIVRLARTRGTTRLGFVEVGERIAGAIRELSGARCPGDSTMTSSVTTHRLSGRRPHRHRDDAGFNPEMFRESNGAGKLCTGYRRPPQARMRRRARISGMQQFDETRFGHSAGVFARDSAAVRSCRCAGAGGAVRSPRGRRARSAPDAAVDASTC